MGDGSYSIEDLERILGLKARTINYWTHEGLFDGPGAGRGARYTDEHLAKLFVIQKLRAEGRPIAEIKAALKRLPAKALRAWADFAKAEPPKDQAKASELVDRWLKESSDASSWVPWRAAPSLSWRPPMSWTARPEGAPSGHWQRIPLALGVELHVQHPASPASQKLVNELVALVRRLNQEETP